MVTYTTELGEKLCYETAHSSIGLRLICEKLNIPYTTVTRWIYDQDHELCKKYLQAKQQQLHYLAEEVGIISDNSKNDYMEIILKNGETKIVQNKESAARTRIRIQARIAIITKLAPILYNIKPEKIKHTVTVLPPPERNPTPPTDQLPDEHATAPLPDDHTTSLLPGAYATPPSLDPGLSSVEGACSEPAEGACASPANGERVKDSPTPPVGSGLTLPQWDRIRKSTDGSSPKTAPKRLPNGDVEWIGENGHRYVSKRVEAPYCSRYY